MNMVNDLDAADADDSTPISSTSFTIAIPSNLLTEIVDIIKLDSYQCNLEEAIIYLLWKGVDKIKRDTKKGIATTIRDTAPISGVARIVIAETAKYYRVRALDLTGRNRSYHITLPRQVAMYICRTAFDLSFPTIGRQFNRHHSTVVHAMNKISSIYPLEDITNILVKINKRIQK